MNRYPHTVDDLPAGDFFAILKPTTVTIPGDERSRTNPGHGYPEHTVTTWSLEVFTSQPEWEAEVKRLAQRGVFGESFKAVRVIAAKISTDVNVQL